MLRSLNSWENAVLRAEATFILVTSDRDHAELLRSEQVFIHENVMLSQDFQGNTFNALFFLSQFHFRMSLSLSSKMKMSSLRVEKMVFVSLENGEQIEGDNAIFAIRHRMNMLNPFKTS